MSAQPHILVVGFGSAGRRHARNLSGRGAAISVVDNRADRLTIDDMPVKGAYATVEAALAKQRFDGAVVATPTAFHVDQTQKLLAARCPVLLEKPVSIDHASAKTLLAAEAAAGLPILLGYTWRWWPALQELRRRVQRGDIGRPLRAEFIMASHLEDWHPGEPLSEFFMSNAQLGGGALLDESHWLDQMIWLFGRPAAISAQVEKISALPIDSDDHVELQAVYPDGLRVRVHLDLYTRPTDRSIMIFGDRGALKWTFEGNTISAIGVGANGWTETRLPGERNDMFDQAAADFLRQLAGETRPPCTLADGVTVLEVIEAARKSQASEGRKISL